MIVTNREQRRALVKANRGWPAALAEVPREQWPTRNQPPGMYRVWRSKGFLVQMHEAPAPAIGRLSINRTELEGDTGRWREGITWDEVQRIKREAGFGDAWAVEVYPADAAIINVANMRHIWLVPVGSVPFAWCVGAT